MAAHTVRVLFLLSAMIVWLVCTLCTFYLRRCEQQQLVPSPARRSSRASNALPNDLCVDRASEGIDCLQQALWGKCSEPFLRGCNASCGRCVSEARQRSLHSTLLVSARQSQPCAEHGADAWVMRAMQNHAEYARANGMALVWSGALIDAAYDGAWNKLTYLLRVLRAELSSDDRPPEERARWLLWADWDVVFTDMAFELPLEEYERRGVRLVLGGDPAAVGGGRPKADYLKANTGVVLLRVHNWSNALLNRMLTRGGRTRARIKAGALLAHFEQIAYGLLHSLWSATFKCEEICGVSPFRATLCPSPAEIISGLSHVRTWLSRPAAAVRVLSVGGTR